VSAPAAVLGVSWRTALGTNPRQDVVRLLAGDTGLSLGRDGGARAAIPGAPAPSKHRRFLSRMGLFAVEAGREALASTGLPAGRRLGLFMGVGGLRVDWPGTVPALREVAPDGAEAWSSGLRTLHPFWLLRHLSNNAHALLSAELGIHGEGLTFAGAIAGAEALAAAQRALEERAVDAALVVAADSLLDPEPYLDLHARGVLARATGELPPPAYDLGARGLVPGESAAALVLARLEDVARPRASVAAVCACDGSSGEPLPAQMPETVRALAKGAAVIDGGARAEPGFDAAEQWALARTEGDARLSSLSTSLGSVGRAAALVKAIGLAECLRLRRLPAIAGLRPAAPGGLRPLLQQEEVSGSVALGLCAGTPGLWSGVRIEVFEGEERVEP